MEFSGHYDNAVFTIVSTDQQNSLQLPSLPSEEDVRMEIDTAGLCEDSYRVKNLDESPDLAKKTQTGIDNCRRLLVSRIPPNITDDQLELYFESHKRSGGGDLESFERINADSAIITFEDSSGECIFESNPECKTSIRLSKILIQF